MKLIIPILILVIVLMAGCTQQNTITNSSSNISAQENVSKEIIDSVVQAIYSNLTNKLNSNVLDYGGSYEQEHDVHSWRSMSSGSTDYVEQTKISIEVKNENIESYTKSFTKGNENEDYYKYFDKSKNKTCKEQSVSRSECQPITLNPPKLGGVIVGCKDNPYPDGKAKCDCNGTTTPVLDTLDFACTEEKNTNNMKLEYGSAIYYPETKKGICIFEVRDMDTQNLWNFECAQKVVEILPINITNNVTPLSNVKCIKYGYDCECEFDKIKTLVCSQEIPESFDEEMKSDTLNYLNNIEIKLISEEDNKYGHCYSFLYNGLNHTFCFNEKNLLTFAQWGSNINNQDGTHIDINKIELKV